MSASGRGRARQGGLMKRQLTLFPQTRFVNPRRRPAGGRSGNRHLSRRALWGAGLFLATSGYARMVRPRMARWGATDNELVGAMPGDTEIPEPDWMVTRAVSIAAP